MRHRPTSCHGGVCVAMESSGVCVAPAQDMPTGLGPMERNQWLASSQRSASIAAMQPDPAAVIACRYV